MRLVKYYHIKKQSNFWEEQNKRTCDLSTLYVVTEGEDQSLQDELMSDDKKNIRTVLIGDQTNFEALQSETIKELIDYLKNNYPNVINIKTEQGGSYSKNSLPLLIQRNELNEMIRVMECKIEDEESLLKFVERTYESTKISFEEKQCIFLCLKQNLPNENERNILLNRISHLDDRSYSWSMLLAVIPFLGLTIFSFCCSTVMLSSVLMGKQRAEEKIDHFFAALGFGFFGLVGSLMTTLAFSGFINDGPEDSNIPEKNKLLSMTKF